MGNSRLLVLALCVLLGLLGLPASASAELGSGDFPDECVFEEGELGHYIVVFYDWVEDPEALAHQQVEQYGGNLGFVYKSALKGYSAEFPPPAAQALQGEPTVNYVEIDHLIWMDASSGVIQWRSCPLAPPLGPRPPVSPIVPEAPEEPGPSVEPLPESPPTVGSAAEPHDQIPQFERNGDQEGERAERRATGCHGRAKKGKRCGPSRNRIDCRKRKPAGKRRCSRGA